MIEPSREEKHALIEAASIFEERGLEIPLPWEGTLDDREQELYTALVLACRAYDKAMRELHGDAR